MWSIAITDVPAIMNKMLTAKEAGLEPTLAVYIVSSSDKRSEDVMVYGLKRVAHPHHKGNTKVIRLKTSLSKGRRSKTIEVENFSHMLLTHVMAFSSCSPIFSISYLDG